MLAKMISTHHSNSEWLLQSTIVGKGSNKLSFNCENLHTVVATVCYIEIVGAIESTALRIVQFSLSSASATNALYKCQVSAKYLHSVVKLITHIKVVVCWLKQIEIR